MNTPTISVIMPAYNCEKYVRQAIDSVLDQTYSHFELLVADDKSTDNTKEIIDSYRDNRIKRFHNTENKGYLIASNLLLEKAGGEMITFQDADDYADPARFEKLIKAFKNNPTVSAVSSDVIFSDENNIEIKRVNYPTSHSDIYEHFSRYRIPLVGSALMIKKNVLETVGLYNTYFNRIGSEDMYWFSHIIQKFQVLNINDFLYYYRSNPNSVSHRNLSYKSVAGFNICVYYMKERAAGRTDHIQAGDWSKADSMMRRFYVSGKLEQGEALSLAELYKISQDTFSALKLYLFQIRHKKK